VYSFCPVQPVINEYVITMAVTLKKKTGIKPKLLSIQEMLDIMGKVDTTVMCCITTFWSKTDCIYNGVKNFWKL